MEVHPPHEPVHSWRDALTHVGLMTIGLFIALMLEGVVEHYHHRELVKSARENIRNEFEANHKAAQQDLGELDRNRDTMNADIVALRSLQAGEHGHHSLNFAMSWQDLSTAAWTTAHETGALGYMPYNEVQNEADVYSLQNEVSNQLLAIFHRETEAFAPVMGDKADFDHMTAADFAQMIRECQIVGVNLYTTKQLLQQLDSQYVEALKKTK